MTLNKRVSLLILPVLLAGYLIVAVGVYSTQKNNLLAVEQRSLDLQATEADALLQRYLSIGGSFIDAMLYSNSLLNYFHSTDKRFKALSLEKGLESLIIDLKTLTSDFWSIALIRSSEQVEYYYEDSLNPFAAINPAQIHYVREAFTSRQEDSLHVLSQEQNRLLLIRIIDRYTLKTPIHFDDESAIALVVSLEPTAFLNKLQGFRDQGLKVSWPQSAPDSALGVSTSVDMPELGRLSLTLPEPKLRKELNYIKFSLLLGFLFIACLSYLLLIFLIKQYVIGPIHKLQKQLAEVDLEAGGDFFASSKQDEIGSLSRAFSQLYDDLGHSYQLAKDLAEKDPLTQLYNRRIFQLRVDQQAQQQSCQFALFFLDLDNFKLVNDHYGHDMGDALLKALARQLTDCMSEIFAGGDEKQYITARLAGDEFAVAVFDFVNHQSIEEIGRRLLSICKDGFVLEKRTLPVSLSIGVAYYPQDGVTGDKLLKNADEAMYEAKRSGKNRVVFYSEEIQARQSNQKQLEAAVKKLDTADLSLCYMPVINPQTGSPCVIEALVRWYSEPFGEITPGVFIPVAERAGMSAKVGNWVIEKAFQDVATLQAIYGSDIRLAINITSAQLSGGIIVRLLLELLTHYRIKAEYIDLEITDSSGKGLNKRDLHTVNQLKGLGFRLILDDFGSEHISVVQLVDYPIDGVKFSKEFIAGLADPDKRGTIIALIHFCRSQGWAVFAEGVEQARQADMLAEAGCIGLQGYYYAQPMPLSELHRAGLTVSRQRMPAL